MPKIPFECVMGQTDSALCKCQTNCEWNSLKKKIWNLSSSLFYWLNFQCRRYELESLDKRQHRLIKFYQSIQRCRHAELNENWRFSYICAVKIHRSVHQMTQQIYQNQFFGHNKSLDSNFIDFWSKLNTR